RAPLSRPELDPRLSLGARHQGGAAADRPAHPRPRQGPGDSVIRRRVHVVIAQVHELTVHYGKRVAVDGLSFTLEAGQIALMLGPNGAGKSTTLSAIAGAILPSAGTIAICGDDVARAPRSIRAKVGFADQPPALYEFFTVAEHVGFVAQARGADLTAAHAVL